MTVGELASALGLAVFTGHNNLLSAEVTGGYAGDLLSDVMSHAREGCVWLTIQTHQNIVAVAVLTGVSAIVICGGRKPDDDTLEKARKEGVVVLGSARTLFETAGKVYKLLGIE